MSSWSRDSFALTSRDRSSASTSTWPASAASKACWATDSGLILGAPVQRGHLGADETWPHPRRTSSRAKARPSPRLAPLTRATDPLMFMRVLSGSSTGGQRAPRGPVDSGQHEDADDYPAGAQGNQPRVCAVQAERQPARELAQD